MEIKKRRDIKMEDRRQFLKLKFLFQEDINMQQRQYVIL